MSGTGTESRAANRGFVGLLKAVQKLDSSRRRSRLFTKAAAAKQLGVSRARLQQMLFLGQLTQVTVGRRELIFL